MHAGEIHPGRVYMGRSKTGREMGRFVTAIERGVVLWFNPERPNAAGGSMRLEAFAKWAEREGKMPEGWKP